MMMMMKCIVTQVLTGTTGIITEGLKEYLKAISGKHSIYSVQIRAVLGILHIIRKYCSLEAGMGGLTNGSSGEILERNRVIR
jgi:hypothetical protein